VLTLEVQEQVEIQVKYAGYIQKQLQEVERMQRLEIRRIPVHMNYEKIRGLSAEAKEKLGRINPQTVGQAARIPGVSPADISILLVFLEQKKADRV
jgi:tRNA uridine 5-carboxymethylaminomethyl modification enzyme